MSVRDDARLPKTAESMLRDWPAPTLDDDRWETMAESLASRLSDAKEDNGGVDLLAAPLPALSDEGTYADTAARSEDPCEDQSNIEEQPAIEPARAKRHPRRDASETSLAEMARASLGESNGRERAAAIAKESFNHLKEERDTGAMADAVVAAATAPNRARVSGGPDSAAAEADARRRASSIPKATEGDARTGQLAAAAMVLVSLAAAAVVWLRSGDKAPAQIVPAVSEPAAEVRAKQRPIAEPNLERAEPTGRSGQSAEGVHVVGAGEPAMKHAKPSTGSAPPVPGPEAEEKLVRSPVAGAAKRRAPAGVNKDPLEDQPRQPAPKTTVKASKEDEDLRPALDEALPLQPSTGAISAALGSVLGQARRCVIGHDRASSAVITFSSSGRVKTVSIAGPAAGNAAEPCLRSALSAARVARFGSPSFTVRGIRIRP